MLVAIDPAACRAPRCEHEALPGSRWCDTCGARLARIRKELAKEEAEKRGTRVLRVRSSCAWFECPDPRKPGSRYCLYHTRIADRVLKT